MSADDGVRLYIDGKLMVDRWDTCCEDVSFSLNLTQDEFYDTVIEYKEHQERAHFKLEWVSLSVLREVIPPARVHYPERVEGRVFQLDVAAGPTITAMTTAEGDGLSHSTAGRRAYFYVQSRDWAGRPLGNGGDDYAISFVGPHEGGGPSGGADSGSFDITATHLGDGQYLAEYVPLYAGTYTISITREGDKISGSDWTMLVSPGELAPSESSHSITSPPITLVAGVTHFFSITTRDIYGNLAQTARDGTAITIKALYEHHDDWLSPLVGVPDLVAWERIYGRDIAGLSVFNNASQAEPDSSYTCQVTIYRAGTFSLDILLNAGHVMASPLDSGVLVEPAEIYAPACIVDGLASVMVAGETYTASIQGRDFYSNNLKALLADAVQVWKAEIQYENPADNYLVLVKAGTLIDKPGEGESPPGYTGVYEVSFTPTLAGP